jgi:hypothetical protein
VIVIVIVKGWGVRGRGDPLQGFLSEYKPRFPLSKRGDYIAVNKKKQE